MRTLLDRTSVEIDTDVGGAIEYCYAQGWTDGLPVVPPEPARRPVHDMQRAGKYIEADQGRQEATTEFDAHCVIDDHVHRGRDADNILITVAGGDAGAHSAFIPSWSQGRRSIRQSKPIGVCLDCN